MEKKVVRWGQIVNDSPVAVRFAGDTDGSVPIDLVLTGYTPVVGERVVLVGVASRQWCILGSFGS